MAELSGKSPEELERELAGVIYRDIRCAENIGEFHHIFCATPVALFNVVGIQTKRPVAVQRAIQHRCV